MMSESKGRGRRGLVWGIVGGLVLLAAIVAVIVALLTPQSSPTDPDEIDSSGSPPPNPTPSSAGEFVDESVAASGWVREPITSDADTYVRAALAAASTFDTQKGTRSDWLVYLDSWFTPDTRYTSAEDRRSDMQASQLELRQAVVLPEDEWNSLAKEDGRVVAVAQGDITYSDVPSDASGDMNIGTSDVVLTFTRSDGSGGETTYDETVRVSVQVLCGTDSVPTRDSAPQPGDCKVVRYFSGSVEP